MKNILKRIGAYLIDIIIVSIIAAVLSNISALNSQLDSYVDVYDEYIKIQSEYKNEKIKEEEFEKKLNHLSYELEKCSVASSIISLACIIAYFGIFQYSQNGRTIGKKIFKLKVVKNDDKDLSIGRFLLRSVILNSIIFTVANIVCVSVLKQSDYMKCAKFISNFELIVQILIFIMMVMSENNRGLHDYIAGTKVIDITTSSLEDNKEKKKKKVIDGEIIEKIKDPKKSN